MDALDALIKISDIVQDSVYQSLPRNIEEETKLRVSLTTSLNVKSQLLRDKELLYQVYFAEEIKLKQLRRVLNIAKPFTIVWSLLIITFLIVFPERFLTLTQAINNLPQGIWYLVFLIVIVLTSLFIIKKKLSLNREI